MAETIPGDPQRGVALAGVAGRLGVIDPAGAAALINQAVAVAGTIPDLFQRSQALAGIVQRLAAADVSDPALIDQAITVAETITNGGTVAGRWPVR